MMADPLLAQSAVDRLKSAAWELVIEGELLPPAGKAGPRRPAYEAPDAEAPTATRLTPAPVAVIITAAG